MKIYICTCKYVYMYTFVYINLYKQECPFVCMYVPCFLRNYSTDCYKKFYLESVTDKRTNTHTSLRNHRLIKGWLGPGAKVFLMDQRRGWGRLNVLYIYTYILYTHR